MKTIHAPLALLTFLVLGATGAADPGRSDDFSLYGRTVAVHDSPPRSGSLNLVGHIVAPEVPRGGGFVLRPATPGCGASARGIASCGCLCSQNVFADGFESGDTSAWSTP